MYCKMQISNYNDVYIRKYLFACDMERNWDQFAPTPGNQNEQNKRQIVYLFLRT